MKREAMVALSDGPFDIIIIGGGATGLGAAVDAASRGYRTLLLERADFAKGTSSRSTKLIHGGLRYLKQGNLALVIEALKERGLLCENAPHLVSPLPFFVPSYHWWEGPFYGIGLKIYDLLAGKLGLEPSHLLSKEEALTHFPTLNPKGLRGGVIYYDGQFDDARLAITLAQTAADQGALLLNYFQVTSLVKEKGVITGVEGIDLETKKSFTFKGKVVINATGVFSDQIRQLDQKETPSMIVPSQGVHLVLDRSFLPSDTAILIPETDDGRVLFFVPWHRHLIVGTTDTPVSTIDLEPRALEEEIEFLLSYARKYLVKAVSRSDILSVFAGLRPLIHGNSESTAALSRDHTIVVSESGLITIAGGKWTTYRKMAQDVIDKAKVLGNLRNSPCRTETLRLHGYKEGRHPVDAWINYGTDGNALAELIKQHPDWGELLHPSLPYLPVEVIWATRYEMARTVEDVLARRTRSLFLDARASIEMAPKVARLMAQELGHSEEWERAQVEEFRAIASGYLTR